ncbi:Response regulator with CheY-like receiver, AAA-type ATPase, and DNA-binding domains (fragment) [Desulfosarcina cetonica]|uniref:sigma 54-interacting transcriptional regulator n=1 Tax=Desulfosarcina cetonica TaxID=90730 RepID=UPI0006CF9A10
MTQADASTTDTSIEAEQIVTVNVKMKALIARIRRIAPMARRVRIAGESGTGKELIAWLFHVCSGRRGAFVAFNAAGVDDQFFSDTLFGHVKGAFSGAESIRLGLVEEARGGTLFLDEIGELNPASQTKLLRLIQEGEFMPLGADRSKTADVQVVVATHRCLREMVNKGTFRKDLYFRLDGHRIDLPPLRQRRDDIIPLVDHFARQVTNKFGLPRPRIGQEVWDLLTGYDYPGNVRELQTMVEVAMIDGNGRIHADAIRDKMARNRMLMDESEKETGSADQSLKKWATLPTIKELDQLLLNEALRRAGGNQTRAAAMLGISQSAVNQRLKKMRGQSPP